MDVPDLSQVERLEPDIDMRLARMWMMAGQVSDDGWTKEIAGNFIRLAYAKGYQDGLTDRPVGKLLIDNGYSRSL